MQCMLIWKFGVLIFWDKYKLALIYQIRLFYNLTLSTNLILLYIMLHKTSTSFQVSQYLISNVCVRMYICGLSDAFLFLGLGGDEPMLVLSIYHKLNLKFIFTC